MSSLIDKLFDQVDSCRGKLVDTTCDLQRHIEELTILKKVTDHLLKTTNLEKALGIVLTGVTSGEAFGFNRAAVFLKDHRTKTLRGVAAIGSSDRAEAGRIWAQLNREHPTLDDLLEKIHTSDSIFTDSYCQAVREISIPLSMTNNSLINVLSTKKPYLVKHGLDIETCCPQLNGLFDVAGFVAVPIATDNFEFGVLIADNFITMIPVTDDDIFSLITFANTAASALENIWLHNELKFKLRELEHAHNLLRENQSYLVQHERLADIGKLATTVTHEIKTPLVTIGAYTRRLLKTYGTKRFKKEHLEVIMNEVQRLETISGEILDYSRDSKLEFKECDLLEVINDTLTIIQQKLKESNISLKTRFSSNPLPINADPNRIRQVLYNLVQNAIDELKNGGTLIIRTRVEDKYIVMETEDTGGGIPPDAREKLFTPFFSTKAKGSGLGLPVSKKIIDDHGGYIRVVSREGVGTRFSVYLPTYFKESVEDNQ
jgi:signal transduction histidine kinase